MDAAGA